MDILCVITIIDAVFAGSNVAQQTYSHHSSALWHFLQSTQVVSTIKSTSADCDNILIHSYKTHYVDSNKKNQVKISNDERKNTLYFGKSSLKLD